MWIALVNLTSIVGVGGREIFCCVAGIYPPRPEGHPSEEGILEPSTVRSRCKGDVNRLFVHGFEGGYGGGRLSAEVAEDPVFEYGVDEYGEGGDEEGVEFAVFGDAEVVGESDEDYFPAVGGVEADEGVGEEDDDKCFGGVADAGYEVADEGFEHGDLGFAIDYQPGEGDDR